MYGIYGSIWRHRHGPAFSHNIIDHQSKYSFVYFFFFRVEAYIRNGWAKDIIDPDGIFSSQQGVSLSTRDRGLPEIDANAVWKPQKEAFLPSNPINFTNAETVNYFVLRSTTDGMPASDVKGMSKSALNLFMCGHLQEITVCYLPQDHVYIKANCIPKMRKGCVYKLTLFLDKSCFDVVGAECGCPAGMGPHASCKHIGGLCYVLEEFTRIGKCPEYLTCTDKFQEWNKRRPKR